MQNRFLKTLALTGAMMGLVSCGDNVAKSVPDEDITPLTLVEKETVGHSPFGALYFDADGNKETYEYIGRIHDLCSIQNQADFKHQKIGKQMPANAWKYRVGSLYKVNVKE